MSSLTNMLLAAMMLLPCIAAFPAYGHDEQNPQHERPHRGTPGCGKWHSEVDQLKTVSVPTSNGQREFDIYIPASYDKHKATPIIMSFHGRDMNSREHALMTHFNDSRVNHDMIVVSPQAIDCLWQGTQVKPIDDLQFPRHMIYYMRENYCIDNDCLYASGFNIGGGFVDNLACSAPEDDHFAAFAMVSPTMYTKPLYPENKKPRCKPSRPHPILAIHGAGDEANCCEGGETKGESSLMLYHPDPDFLKRWAERNGCNKAPDTCTKYGGLVETTSYICQDMEGFVQGIKVGGQKNGWSSTEDDKGGKFAAVGASKKIIEFFKGYYKGHA